MSSKVCGQEGGLFPGKGVLDEHLRGRRREKVSRYLGSIEDEGIREEVLKSCTQDLRDVGVELAGMGEGDEEDGVVLGVEGVKMLEELGMGREEAEWALEETGGDVERAAGMILGI